VPAGVTAPTPAVTAPTAAKEESSCAHECRREPTVVTNYSAPDLFMATLASASIQRRGWTGGRAGGRGRGAGRQGRRARARRRAARLRGGGGWAAGGWAGGERGRAGAPEA